MTENIEQLEVQKDPNLDNKQGTLSESILSSKHSKTRKQKKKLLKIFLFIFLLVILLFSLVRFFIHNNKKKKEIETKKKYICKKKPEEIIDFFLPSFIETDKLNITNDGLKISTLLSDSNNFTYAFSKRVIGKNMVSIWKVRLNRYDPNVNEIKIGIKYNNKKDEINEKKDSWFFDFKGTEVKQGEEIFVAVNVPRHSVDCLKYLQKYKTNKNFIINEIGDDDNEFVPFIGIKGQGVEIEVVSAHEKS